MLSCMLVDSYFQFCNDVVFQRSVPKDDGKKDRSVLRDHVEKGLHSQT